jgi:hypothetical protein
MTVSVSARPGLPVIRTWRSARFRLLIAAALSVFGLLLWISMARILLAGGGIPLEDFISYYGAAMRMGAGESPYSVEQLAGPIDAVCQGCYLYPPLLAQLTMPLTSLPLEVAKIPWAVLLSGAALASAWIGAGVGGADRTWERVLWTIAATTWFLPVFHSVWLGNVSTLIALGAAVVAIGGVAAGLGAAFTTWLKVSPLVYLPLALLADPRSRVTAAVALLALLPLVVLAPAAWIDMPLMLLNLVRGSGDVYLNLAPAAMATNLGWPEAVVTAVRLAALAGGAFALLAALWMARRPRGLPLATLLATVTMLLIPGTFWYHYLAVLLPLSAMAWPRAHPALKLALVAGAIVTSLAGLNSIPIGVSFFSAAFMLAVAGWVLWPRDLSSAGEPA